MAVDMFLDLDKIKGESQDKTWKDKIDILAWSWGMSQSGTMHTGGGGGSGKANFQDISITKYLDKASTDLMKACSKGDHIAKAKLVVRKAGSTPLEYLTIELTGVLISSISTGGSGGEDRLTENITLNFKEFKVKYQPQKADGSKDGGVLEHGFNIAQNVTT